MYPSRVWLAAAVLILTGCAGAHRHSSNGGPDEGRSSVSRIVIRVSEMTSPVNLVTLIQSRVSNLEVRRVGACPELEFRGRNSVMLPTPPMVYVNGQRTVNTCVLDLLDPKDISSVEIYPMGVTNRPGYYATAGGLILVFMKDGSEEEEAG